MWRSSVGKNPGRKKSSLLQDRLISSVCGRVVNSNRPTKKCDPETFRIAFHVFVSSWGLDPPITGKKKPGHGSQGICYDGDIVESSFLKE